MIQYWVSIDGMVYPAACSTDEGLAVLIAAGLNAWKTIDGRVVSEFFFQGG